MAVARAGAACVAISDTTVMVAGGRCFTENTTRGAEDEGQWTILESCELFDFFLNFSVPYFGSNPSAPRGLRLCSCVCVQ